MMAEMTKVAARDIGDLGEDDFQRWCTLNKLLCTKSIRDRMGWDYLVEFKPAVDVRIGLDSQNELKKVLVQVKASDRTEQSIRAKLSALKQLVDAEMPSFIVIIHYEGGSVPRKAWLLHIGAKQIEAILRKVRETESKGRKDLHAVKFRLCMIDAAPLRVDGSDLFERLKQCIGPSMADYVARKSLFRRTCGYDGMPFVGSAQLAPGVGLPQIADWQIGRIPHIRIAQATVHKLRFGIALDKETQRFDASLAKIDAKPKWKGTVTASSEAHGLTADMVVDIYCSDPLMGGDLWRLRFTNRFLDIYLPMKGNCELKFTINAKQRDVLSDLVQALKFGWLMSQVGTRLKCSNGECEIDLELPTHCAEFEHFKHMYGFAERFSAALHRFKPHHAVQVTAGEIEQALWANEKAYSALSHSGFGFSFNEDDPAKLAVAETRSGVILLPLCMALKEVIYHAIVRIEASVSNDEVVVRVGGGCPHVIEEGIALKRDVQSLGEKILKRAMLLRARRIAKGEW